VAAATAAVVGRLLHGQWSDGLFGTYHLTSAGATSWFGFAERILALDPSRAEQSIRRIRAVHSADFPADAERPRNGVLSNDKFATRFGFTRPDWVTELRRTLVSRVPS
jgi:dTDP-4-dehydrorhamnose reductase